jgi:hypothetical protein
VKIVMNKGYTGLKNIKQRQNSIVTVGRSRAVSPFQAPLVMAYWEADQDKPHLLPGPVAVAYLVAELATACSGEVLEVKDLVEA